MFNQMFKSWAPLPLLERLLNRNHRIFALGTPKSGTTSIASMFADSCRVGHEPRRPTTVADMHGHFLGSISDEQLQRSYQARDRQLMLDLESNCFLAYRPDILHASFPGAKFITTVRNPLTWLDSIFDNNINFPRSKTKTMSRWHEVFFHASERTPTQNDEILSDKGLHSIDSYLNYWTRTNERCLRMPGATDNLLVGTNEISIRAAEIADFAGLDPSAVSPKKTHANQTSTKHRILQQLNQLDVEESLKRICGPLISEFRLASLWV